ncbi:MAG: carboxypeptidase regulatory-like domain-containing protein, partial [Syntrophothermus sp.]
MLSGNYRIPFLSVFLILLTALQLFAGTTGKIAGRVTDKATGEPLPGVNVAVRGTYLGGTTGEDGYYVILNVPPGTHSIIASMIGYANVTVNEIRVRIDETSPVNFSMMTQAIEAASVSVIAERNIVKQDVSTSVSEVQPDEMSELPVTTINDIVRLQAGVEEGFVVRGGAADQLLFQIDGITLRDPRNNQPISSVALSSIQEVSIERGGFNAEYGQVRSGIINIVGREGAIDSYYGSFQTKYSPATPKHFGMSVFDAGSMWNRPYLDPAVAWTGTQNGAWDQYTQRQYPQFEGWNAISAALMSDNDPTNDLSPVAAQKLWEWEHRRRPVIAPDYSIDASFGGPIPLVGAPLGNLRFFASYFFNREMLLIPLSRPDFKEYNWSVKLNSDITNSMKLMLNVTSGKTYNVAMNVDDVQFNSPTFGIVGVANNLWYPTDFLRTPYQIAHMNFDQRPSRIFTDSWYSQADVGHIALSGKLTGFITNNSFYEISLEHLNRDYKTGPIRARDTTRRYEIVPGYFVDEAPFGYSSFPATGIGQSGMFFGGHSAQMRDSSVLNSYVFKGNLSSQINKEHLVKVGFEFTYYDLKLDYGKVSPFFHDYNYVKQTWRPYLFSGYAQDKIEMLGFIANVGLRVDVSNPNTEWVNIDP